MTHTASWPTGQRPGCFKSSPKTHSQSVLVSRSVSGVLFFLVQDTRTTAVMQRAFFSRGALLAHQAAASLDSPLAARSAPLLQRLDRSMSSVTIPPPACMLRPLEVPLRYLFGPGPSNVPPRILAAGSRPIIGHLHPEMYEVNALFLLMNYVENKHLLRTLTEPEHNLCIGSSL